MYPIDIQIAIITRLMQINPDLAGHNLVLSPRSPSLQIIADSGLTQSCSHCGRDQHLIDFPVVNRQFNPNIDIIKNIKNYACCDCLYADAVAKIKFNIGNLDVNPVFNLVYEAKTNAIENGWIVMGKCFCGLDAEEIHHPNYRRPLDGIGHCKAHHVELHKIIKALFKEIGFIPEHYKGCYYRHYIDKVQKCWVYVVRPEYADEIIHTSRPLTIRETIHKDADELRRRLFPMRYQ